MIQLNGKYGRILCVPAMLALAFAEPVGAAQIRGTVTDGDGLPIENVWITAFDAAGDWITNAATGSAGLYNLGPVDPGSYYLQAEAGWDNPCLAVVCYDGRVGYFHFYRDSGRQGELASIDVSSEDVIGINFMLSEIGGMVQGRLTASDGITPIENAGAVLHSEDGPWVAGAGTDSNGDYVMYGVPVGTYVMEAWGPEDSFFAPATYHLPESLPGPLWYEGNMANATRVSVHPCAMTNNIDAQLPAGGAICGTVTTEMGVPVNGILMEAFSTNGQGLAWVNTGPDGSYSLGVLLPGDYYVTVWAGEDHPTLETVTYNGHPDGFWHYWDEGRLDELDSVIVASDQCTDGVDFALPVGGAITGRVTEADEVTPISNARVELFDDEENYIDGARTEDDGSYMLPGVAPGLYVAHARRPEDACYQSRTYDDLPGKIWHHDNLVNATRINVWSGAITSAIDFHLPFGNTISGTVTEEDDVTPIAGVAVEAYDPDRDWGKQRYSSDGGVYELCVGAGGYIMDAWGPWDSYFTQETYEHLPGNRHTRDNWDNATWIVVGEGEDVPGIDFSLRLGGRITGTVWDAGNTGVENVTVQAFDLDGWHIMGTGTRDQKEAGQYAFILDPGTYYVNANTSGNPDFCHLASVSYDGHPGSFSEWYWCSGRQDELQTVQVQVGYETAGIDLVMPAAGWVTGIVTEPDGSTPLEGASVGLYDDNFCWEEYAWTEADGTYEFCSLVEGSYVADARGPEGLCHIPETFEGLPGRIWDAENRADATRFEVVSSSVTPDINFHLSPGGIITGTVKDLRDDTGIFDAWVSAYEENLDFDSWTPTAEDGMYVHCLPAGEYILDAWGPSDSYFTQKTFEDLPGNRYTRDNWDNATRIVVEESEAVPGIDFSLSLGGKITGVIHQAGRTPVDEILVQAYDSDGWHMMGTGSGENDVPGQYTFTLEPGSYYVNAFDVGWNPDTCLLGPVSYDGHSGKFDTYACNNRMDELNTVDVYVEQETADIDFLLPQGGAISGRVTESDGGTPLPDASVDVYDEGGGCWIADAWTEDDGSYTVCGLPHGWGDYVVEVCPPEGMPYQCETYDNLPGRNWCGDNLANATRVPTAPGLVTPDIDFSLEPVPVGLAWPNGGEVLTAGSTYDINWNPPPDAAGDLGIFLLEGDEPQCPESGGLLNIVPYANGTYSWTPSPFLDGDDYAIKLCLMIDLQNCDICDRSDEWFSIIGGIPPPPTITVTAPRAGETWFWGREVCIEWEVDYPDLPALEGMEVVVALQPAFAPVVMFAEVARITDGQLCLEAPCHVPQDQDYVAVVVMPDNLCVLDFSDPFSIMPEPADFDVDCDVDLRDIAHFQRCFSGEGSGPSGACQDADLDDEGDVDLFDYGILFGSRSAPRYPGGETRLPSGEEDARIRRALDVLSAPVGESHDPSQLESRRMDGVSRSGS